MPSAPLLSVEGLAIAFGPSKAARHVVEDVSFAIRPGETLAVVGESGSGKTLTGRALLGVLPRGARVTAGRAVLRDAEGEVDLLSCSERAMQQVRGDRVAMIFQEPMSALSPLHTVGAQVLEGLFLHAPCSRAEGEARCLETFAEVGFPDPERAFAAYPFELSGGLRQRAMIAMAMVCRPSLMIADEPTTALDVTTQATVLDLIRRLQGETGMSVMLITHDLGVVANVADSVAVLRQGRLMESGSAETVLGAPGHAYTRRLLAAAPVVGDVAPCAARRDDPILTVRRLSKTYPGRNLGLGRRAAPVHAAADVNFRILRGGVLAVVGESGSGKSTVARLVLRAEAPDPGGEIRFRGRDGSDIDVGALDASGLKAFRRRAQMVFQDPFAALSPRMPVRDILTEPLRVHGVGDAASQKARAAALMRRVGLPAEHLARYPHAFSGGQRQRIAIARALALEPELLVCDEPTSALDVSVQAQVLDLLREVRADLGLSMLFISHDLAVVAALADRVAVMRRGRVVEEAPVDRLFGAPEHPYTRALLAASPEPHRRLDLRLVALGAGEPESWPDPYGYRGDAAPPLTEIRPDHFVRCAA
ncbi:ABC transporter ATP-binding protein [Rubrimonas cliftonensis]|uniref:Peptide/nickel transport system ATP-binding protein n=1 Tax=Rubrimonas cliftonensis TaxID=89524 RepID=A0A1H3YGQ1_9RHOB|nr:ABC transporter ATP-binding protein [Rubrimonas cliftonensis]SEA10760.1 peptide/nickel transport system ATP-binding protein [Rubrimonas cliftonensis]